MILLWFGWTMSSNHSLTYNPCWYSTSTHNFWRSGILSRLLLLFWSFSNLRCVIPFRKKFWKSPCYSPNLLQLLLRPFEFFLNICCFFCCNLKILVKLVFEQYFQNQHQMTNFLFVFLLPPICIFSYIFVHLSNSLHKLLNKICDQSTLIPSSTLMNVSALLLLM